MVKAAQIAVNGLGITERDGELEKRATMHEVAELAGVSQATVSLVLNGVPNARVSKATRRRGQEAAEQLGYRRGKTHPVPAGRTRVVGLFIDEVSTTPFAAPFIEGARDEAAPATAHKLGGARRGETPASWRREVHWEFDFREVASGRSQEALGVDLDDCSLAVIRDERYKYVHFAGLPPLLFDLQQDPGELHNVVEDANYQAVRVTMAEKLLAWRSRHLDRRLTGISLTAGGPVDARAVDRT